MSLAQGDLRDSPGDHPKTASEHEKDKPPSAENQYQPDQRYKGYSSDDYAASNPWYGQPRSSPVFGLAESLPHTVRHRHGRRYEERGQDGPQKHGQDVEKGKEEGRSRDARVDEEDSSSQEKVGASAGEKTLSGADSSQGGASENLAEEEERQANYDRYRNPIARFRERHKDVCAEYLATTVTVFLALCGNLSYRLNPNYGSYESLCWTNGLSTMAGIYLAGGVSGSHINPVVTVALAVYRGFPWNKVWRYVIAQFLGSITAGFLAYLVYHDGIHLVDPGLTGLTGKSLYTIPQPFVSAANAFWSEFMSIATMVCIFFALGDDQNSPPGSGMEALIVGLVYTMLSLTLGYNTGPCINPMRDFAVRLVGLIVGYGGGSTFRNWWWIGGSWGADIAGAMAGAAVYDVFIYTGNESPVNYLWARDVPKTRPSGLNAAKSTSS